MLAWVNQVRVFDLVQVGLVNFVPLVGITVQVFGNLRKRISALYGICFLACFRSSSCCWLSGVLLEEIGSSRLGGWLLGRLFLAFF